MNGTQRPMNVASLGVETILSLESLPIGAENFNPLGKRASFKSLLLSIDAILVPDVFVSADSLPVTGIIG